MVLFPWFSIHLFKTLCLGYQDQERVDVSRLT